MVTRHEDIRCRSFRSVNYCAAMACMTRGLVRGHLRTKLMAYRGSIFGLLLLQQRTCRPRGAARETFAISGPPLRGVLAGGPYPRAVTKRCSASQSRA